MTLPKDFGFSEEASLLKQTSRDFLQNKLPTEKLHQLVADDPDSFRSPVAKWDRELWREMTALGWSTLSIPDSLGGLGMPAVAVAGLVEETSRAALPSPLMSTLQACFVLAACESEHANTALQKILSGQAATLAITDQFGSWDAQDSGVSATPVSDGYRLNGTAWFVQDAAKADFYIVKAKGDEGIGLFSVDAGAAGLNASPDHIVDLTRDQAHIEFANVEVADSAVLALPGGGVDAMHRAEPVILTLIAADIVGAGEWQLQTTVEYAKTRVQFDHPLGFFQAVKHPLVDLMLLIDQARALVYTAACAIDHEPRHAEKYARMAKAAACEVAAFGSRKSMQLHGGIGYTWECFVQIYFKRQIHNQMLFGDAAYQRTKLADLIIGTA